MKRPTNKKSPRKATRRPVKTKRPAKKTPKKKLSLASVVAALRTFSDGQLLVLSDALKRQREGRIDTSDFDEGDWEAVDSSVHDGNDRVDALRTVRQTKDDDARIAKDNGEDDGDDGEAAAETPEGEADDDQPDDAVVEAATAETLSLAKHAAAADPGPDDDDSEPKTE